MSKEIEKTKQVNRPREIERAPVKIVKGKTANKGLAFNLKEGAIVARPGSAVVFVCG